MIDENHFQMDEKKFHNWYKNKEIWKSIYKWASEAKQIYFTGGEPTLIEENWELIDYLKEKGYSKNIHLMFSLNCTQVPDKLLDTFSTFSSAAISLSVDGYKEVQEYIRYPSRWKEIEDNVKKILKNRNEYIFFYFSPVIQIYNILNFPRLFKWIDNLQINYGKVNNYILMCTAPEFLDIAILPNNIKQEAFIKD